MKNLDGIKNIFFDLGGVLIDIDFSKTFDAFAELGIPDAHKINDRPELLQLFMDLECGVFLPDEFLRRFRILIDTWKPIRSPNHHGIDHQQPPIHESAGSSESAAIISAFCALLRDYKPGHIELVQSLRSQYRVFLLSNTNALHAEYFNGKLKAEYGIENFDHLMEKAFYSHDLGYRKPDLRIFQKAIQLAGVHPEETLFIDDLQKNVDAAIKCGLKGVKVDDDYTILDIFGNS